MGELDKRLLDLLMEECKKQVNRKEQQSLIKLCAGSKYCYVSQEEICYIVSDRSSTTVFTDSKEYRCSRSLGEWMKLLNYPLFVHCHRSYIVNVCKILDYKENKFILSSGEKVCVSRRFAQSVFSMV